MLLLGQVDIFSSCKNMSTTATTATAMEATADGLLKHKNRIIKRFLYDCFLFR